MVVLNSNCTVVTGGCASGSPQQKWSSRTWPTARPDANGRVAPSRWSNGIAGSDARTSALYDTLLDNNVDVLLSGHEADYERFAHRWQWTADRR